MKPRYLILGFVLFLVAIFIAANWQMILQPSTLNLIFASVTAPLGVVLLSVIGGVVLLYQVVLIRTETQLLLESRRAGKEIERLRKLAEAAESSRFESLRQDLVDGMAKVTEGLGWVHEALGNIDERMGKVDEGFGKFDGRFGQVEARLAQPKPAPIPAAPERRELDPPVEAEAVAEVPETTGLRKIFDRFKPEKTDSTG